MTDKKVTKTENFEKIKAILADANETELVEFVDAQIAQLAHKAEKAKERAAEKKAKGDELREKVYGVLTNEFQSLDEIAGYFADSEDVTRNKITARLTQLVNTGAVEKEQQKGEGGRKYMTYRVAADVE